MRTWRRTGLERAKVNRPSDLARVWSWSARHLLSAGTLRLLLLHHVCPMCLILGVPSKLDWVGRRHPQTLRWAPPTAL
jgi:hypothetical protein